jgi:acetyltransferase
VANPVDMLAGSGPGTYAVALDALLSDPTVDSVLVIAVPNDWFLPASLAEVISEVAAVHHKPVLASIMGLASVVLASIMGLASVDQALAILHRRRVPNFAFPERAPSALAAMFARRQWLNTPPEAPAELTDVDQSAARAALDQGDLAHTLAAYGITLPPTRLAPDADKAVRLAEEVGYPVVLKLVSPDITHKSDIGGVALNLAGGDTVRTAFDRIVRCSPGGRR